MKCTAKQTIFLKIVQKTCKKRAETSKYKEIKGGNIEIMKKHRRQDLVCFRNTADTLEWHLRNHVLCPVLVKSLSKPLCT